MERHETPDPVRSDAVNPRFHCVRQQADRHAERLGITVWNTLPGVDEASLDLDV